MNALSGDGIPLAVLACCMVAAGGLDRVRGLLPRLFRVTNTSGFFLPVAIIILQDKGFGLGFVGLAYAGYALAKLLVESPTGYLGDLLGRRASLGLGSAIRALVVGVSPFVPSEALYLRPAVQWTPRSAARRLRRPGRGRLTSRRQRHPPRIPAPIRQSASAGSGRPEAISSPGVSTM